MNSTPPIHILLVEDSDSDAELVRRQFRNSGVVTDFERVMNEQEFRRALGAEPDVILADYSLPEFDGMSALRIARESAPDIPFIFVSGSIGEEQAIEALRSGAIDYVLKDRPSRLLSAVMRALDQRRETSRKRATLAALRESEERFHYAAMATRDVIWDLDVAAETFWANEALRTVWKHDIPADAIPLQWWADQVHPSDAGHAARSLHSAIHSDATRWRAEYQLRRGDGTYGHALDRGFIVRDAQGRPVRVIGAIQDMSDRIEGELERVRLEETVERASRVASLGRLAATVAHEFNNILMAIQPYTEIIRARAGEDPVLRDASDHVAGAVARGGKITREILQTTHAVVPALASVEMSSWFERMRPEISAMLGPGVELVILPSPSHPTILCDPEHLNQIVFNLAANARDAMHAKGKVSISVEPADSGEVRLSVEDTGPGMDPGILPHIFEPLFTTKARGTGLGLAVVRQLVSSGRGRIEVDTVPGLKTRFDIFLPAATHATEPPPLRSRKDVSIRRIALIEDDEEVAAGLMAILEIEGFEVRLATTAAAATSMIADFQPDAVILDVSLPDRDGISLYQELAIRWPAIRVLFSTGHADSARFESLAGRSNVGWLRKPYDFDTLLRALSQLH